MRRDGKAADCPRGGEIPAATARPAQKFARASMLE
ncbi:hypothetical protein HNR51_005293 [Methylorubrum thiocyanatum]|uniref:Uncharacterized protein n=1 Tax=Methylorubrum thiocyanatum TaxID=47958 RepID=A0AA40S7Y2_9HYPH|nr:hypothetical protein [Methylorubrum thiocyanatum]GJE78699.1 hypothetical protein CJNNKLLH_0022 [Methylorubrum thiocyanatum]